MAIQSTTYHLQSASSRTIARYTAMIIAPRFLLLRDIRDGAFRGGNIPAADAFWVRARHGGSAVVPRHSLRPGATRHCGRSLRDFALSDHGSASRGILPRNADRLFDRATDVQTDLLITLEHQRQHRKRANQCHAAARSLFRGCLRRNRATSMRCIFSWSPLPWRAEITPRRRRAWPCAPELRGQSRCPWSQSACESVRHDP